MAQASEAVSMYDHLTGWVDACRSKPEDLPALFAMVSEFAEIYRPQIALVYPEEGQGNLTADLELESAPSFGCVTDEMLKDAFSGAVADTLIRMKNIELDDPQAQEHRDYALTFLWCNGDFIYAMGPLEDLVRPFTRSVDRILAEYHEALRGAGHDVDKALREMSQQAAYEDARLARRSIQDMGMETLGPIAGYGTIAEYEDALRVALGLRSPHEKYGPGDQPAL